MEQEITHYSRGKLYVDQITVRESARSTKCHRELNGFFMWQKSVLYIASSLFNY
jgi:hypothetical protein